MLLIHPIWLDLASSQGVLGGGVVLDPFMGSGTTALVAKGIGRDYIGIELNPEYKAIAERRLFDKFGLFL